MVVTALAWLATRTWAGLAEAVLDGDVAVLRWFETLRHGPGDRIAELASGLGDPWGWRPMRWLTLAALIGCRRVRHLLVFVVLLLAVTAATTASAASSVPYPSAPVAMLGVSLIGAMYTLLPRGRARNRAKLGALALMGGHGLARLVLALDRPSSVGLGLLVGVAVPVVVFRWLTPNDTFPITYRRDRRPRSLDPALMEALRSAMLADHGCEVLAARLLRPPGSSGSTPMHLVVQPPGGGAPLELFAKLYSLAHLRADRWYKLARVILYGRLEDEAPFVEIRQLVEHEDYLLRLAARADLPVPATLGFSELTPGRDYLLVMEWLQQAEQLGNVSLPVDVIDQGIVIVRRLRAAGIAHRDIKPANLVVSGGRLFLVDLSFGEARPSPWREAVDLATMMLCLGLVADPVVVYERAVRLFTPDEVGEAFAAARSVTIPAQLRHLVRAEDPALANRFVGLAPAHPPIRIQRWTARRVSLAAAMLAAGAAALGLVAFNLDTAGLT